MKKLNGNLKDIVSFFTYSLSLIRHSLKLILNDIFRYREYLKDKSKYMKMEGAEPIEAKNMRVILNEKTSTTSIDYHYFYQDIWAFKKIYESKCKQHIDVGSKVDFVGFLSVFTEITFIDIRPLIVYLEKFKSIKGNILSLPYEENSVSSLSCLHVAEHIGLGRYGDILDPYGTKKAAKELTRVLAKGGNLYFSLPIGKPRICFNAHRVHSTQQILEYFSELKLIEISGINDDGVFIKNIEMGTLDSCEFGCGLFWFTKT